MWLLACSSDDQWSFGVTDPPWGLCKGRVWSAGADPAAAMRNKCASRENTYNLSIIPTAHAEVGALQGLQWGGAGELVGQHLGKKMGDACLGLHVLAVVMLPKCKGLPQHHGQCGIWGTAPVCWHWTSWRGSPAAPVAASGWLCLWARRVWWVCEWDRWSAQAGCFSATRQKMWQRINALSQMTLILWGECQL